MPTLKKPVFMDKIPVSRGKTAKFGKTEAPFRPVFRVKRPFFIEKSAEFCGPLKKEPTPPAKLNFSYMYKKGVRRRKYGVFPTSIKKAEATGRADPARRTMQPATIWKQPRPEG